MKIENEFIPFEQALALKELGFNEPCLASWTYKTRERIPTLYGCGALLFDTDGLITNQTEDIICSAPLYQQAFRWFREKYDLQYNIVWNKFYDKTHYQYEVRPTWRNEPLRPYGTSGMCSAYEEAELECLKKLIEICKDENIRKSP